MPPSTNCPVTCDWVHRRRRRRHLCLRRCPHRRHRLAADPTIQSPTSYRSRHSMVSIYDSMHGAMGGHGWATGGLCYLLDICAVSVETLSREAAIAPPPLQGDQRRIGRLSSSCPSIVVVNNQQRRRQ